MFGRCLMLPGMAEALIIQTLKDKRAEINGRIAAYMAQIAQAKHDLAHINASIRLFSEPDRQRATYMVSQTVDASRR